MNDLDDVPRWITDLVPVAERARAVLLRELPFAVAVAALAIALAMGTGPGLRWALIAGCLHGLTLALRHGGPLPAPTAGRAPDGGPGSRWGTEASPPGGGPAPSGGGPAPPLRPGTRTGALLAVTDIIGTGVGLLILGGARLAGLDEALLGAALTATGLILVATAVIALQELLGPGSRQICALAGGALACSIGPLLPWSWWWVLAMAVIADLLSIIAIARGRRRDSADSAVA